MRRRLTRAGMLTEMIRAVNASLEPERVADAIAAHASAWIPAPGWLVVAVTDEGEIREMASRGIPSTLEEAVRIVGEFVARSTAPFFSGDIAADPRLPKPDPRYPPASVMGFQLECRGRVVGALIGIDRVPSTREPRLSAATLTALRHALEPGAFALDNGMRMQRVEALSVTDDLTQLYNSRYLSQVLRRETKRATRGGRPLSLLFIDLDGFKSVNDKHGHLAGSAALVEAAAVIRASARETDIVARFGGDEFALVLPDTGTEGATAVGDRIRDKIAAHQFLKNRGLGIRLTVSVGVATLPDVATSAEQLIHAADGAMYWVKDHGKNDIYVAGS
jgi:diguanylate cyclase (GGDEF)-like protein